MGESSSPVRGAPSSRAVSPDVRSGLWLSRGASSRWDPMYEGERTAQAHHVAVAGNLRETGWFHRQALYCTPIGCSWPGV